MFFDLHLDLLQVIVKRRLAGEHGVLKTYLPALKHHRAVILNYYFEGGNPLEELLTVLVEVQKEVQESAADVDFVFNKSDLRRESGKLKVLLALEGLAPVTSEALAETIFNAGIRALSLTWNDNNALAAGGAHPGGLKALGRAFAKRFVALGGLIDLAHASADTAAALLTLFPHAVFVSHTGFKPFYDHPRNLEYKLVQELINNQRLIGVGCAFFLAPNKERRSENLLAHLALLRGHNGAHLAAIGTDFLDFLDPNDTPSVPGLAGLKDTKRLIVLVKNTFGEAADDLLFFNAWRFFSAALPD